MVLLPPELSDAIDRLMRADLLYWATVWSRCLAWSTGVVITGLVFEGPETAHDIISLLKGWREQRRERLLLKEVAAFIPVPSGAFKSEPKSSHTPKWMTVMASVGWSLIVLGVAGELVSQAYVEAANNAIQTFDNARLTAAQVQAGNAARSSKTAHDEAETASDSASSALSTARDARQETARLKSESTELATNLSTTKAQLEAVDAKRAELEKSLINLAVCTAPRVIESWSFRTGNGPTTSYVDPLRPMAGQLVFIEVVPDAEARRAALYLARTLHDAQWSVQPLKFEDGLKDGVSVRPYFPAFKGLAREEEADMMVLYLRTSQASDKLLEFLHSYNWQATQGPPTGAIHDETVLPTGAIRIQVGLYPPAVYVSPPGQKELTSRIDEMKQQDAKAQAEAKRRREERLATLPPEVRQRVQQQEAEIEADEVKSSHENPCQVLNPPF